MFDIWARASKKEDLKMTKISVELQGSCNTSGSGVRNNPQFLGLIENLIKELICLEDPAWLKF
jgi:hypothetical protein